MTKFIELHDLRDDSKISVNIDRINYFCESSGYKDKKYVPCTSFSCGDDFCFDVKELYDDIVSLLQRI